MNEEKQEKTQEEVEKIVKCKYNKTFFLFVLGIVFFIGLASAVTWSTPSDVLGVNLEGADSQEVNLTFQFTTCSLSDCSDANFSTIYTNATFSNLSELNNASYFQYRAIFFTENQSYTPYLFNVTVDYDYLDTTNPLISFNPSNPANDSGASEQFEINLSITEEYPANMTYNWNGSNTTVLILDSLLLMLNFDNLSALGENDTYVVDSSINEYIGIVKNAVWNSSGKYGGAFEFDGNSSININQRLQCPEGMAYINKLGGYCIDKYEAVAMNADGTWNESSDDHEWDNSDTTALLNAGGYAGSEAGHYPWVYISANQARTACENAGKHLCTSEEWLGAANIKGQIYNLDATISDCTVSTNCILGNNLGPNGGDACYGGSMTNCVSSEGVYDMVGNVLEITSDVVDTNSPSGNQGWHYINTTDLSYSTSSLADDGTYGKDGTYFGSGTKSNRAVLRGGYWSEGANAGPFGAGLYDAPADARHHIGFRCCSVP